MKRKVLATLLSATMVAGLLAGCGDKAEEPATAPAEAEEPAEEAEEPAEEAEEPAEESGASSDAIQALIDATTDTVTLTVWASEEDQDLTTQLLESFKSAYPEVTFDITVGAVSEGDAKDTVLTDVEAAADVYTFADDQINELVAAGALQPVSATYTFDVATENVASSIEAASVDGTLYAYPMTADNGYFMFYNKEFFSEDDVKSMDTMLQVASDAGKKVSMELTNAWYLYSFFKGAGLDMGLTDDGVTNFCDWDAEGGVDVAQGILDICENPGFLACSDAEFATGIAEGNIIAGVNGTWRAEDAQKAWGDNYAATKLPTFTVAGNQVQMASFSGCKLVGVNPHSSNVGWSMLLAEYLTSEDAQVSRFEGRGLGPSNINAGGAEAVQAAPAVAALAEQAEFATPQRVGGSYWEPANTLGTILSQGNPDGTDLQELLTNAVEGITQPPVTE